MKAFVDSIVTKEELVMELKKHQEADNFIRGAYFKNGKGCAVGCSLESASRLKGVIIDTSDHSLYEDYFNIPEYFALLCDRLFEGMSLERSKTFPLDIIEAVKVGTYLDSVEDLFNIAVLELNLKTLSRLSDDYGVIEVTKNVIKVIKSNDVEARLAARLAAESVWSARSAVWSARSAAISARSAVWSAVWSAARSVESAARSARSVESAAESAAWSVESAERATTESAAYDHLADELIKLVKEIK